MNKLTLYNTTIQFHISLQAVSRSIDSFVDSVSFGQSADATYDKLRASVSYDWLS